MEKEYSVLCDPCMGPTNDKIAIEANMVNAHELHNKKIITAAWGNKYEVSHRSPRLTIELLLIPFNLLTSSPQRNRASLSFSFSLRKETIIHPVPAP